MKENGSYKKYYNDGQLAEEGACKDDKQEGLKKEYYKNGQLRAERNYKDGKQEGFNKVYSNGGQLLEESNYENDKQEGSYKVYYECGQLAEEGNYKNDKIEGKVNRYRRNGEVICVDIYSNGEKINCGELESNNSFETIVEPPRDEKKEDIEEEIKEEKTNIEETKSDIRKCPFCSEEIQDNASQCEHCKAILHQEAEIELVTSVLNEKNHMVGAVKTFIRKNMLLVCIVPSLLLVILAWGRAGKEKAAIEKAAVEKAAVEKTAFEKAAAEEGKKKVEKIVRYLLQRPEKGFYGKKDLKDFDSGLFRKTSALTDAAQDDLWERTYMGRQYVGIGKVEEILDNSGENEFLSSLISGGDLIMIVKESMGYDLESRSFREVEFKLILKNSTNRKELLRISRGQEVFFGGILDKPMALGGFLIKEAAWWEYN